MLNEDIFKHLILSHCSNSSNRRWNQSDPIHISEDMYIKNSNLFCIANIPQEEACLLWPQSRNILCKVPAGLPFVLRFFEQAFYCTTSVIKFLRSLTDLASP